MKPSFTYQADNIELLRQRIPEYMPTHRAGIIRMAVENLRSHAAVEAQTVAPVVYLEEYKQRKAAELFDKQVTQNLSPQTEQPVISVETQATVTDLDLHRKKAEVDAVYDSQIQQGYGNPLLEELLSNAEEAA